MADMEKICPESFPCRVSCLAKTFLQGKLFILLCILIVDSGGAMTHWVVTEDGKIKQEVDSPLNLKHPDDVVIFMRQESRVSYLKKLEKMLVAQKIHIEENEDRDTGLEQRHYKEDADCIMAKVPLGDLDLYDGTYISLESKDISPEDYVDLLSALPPDLEKPDCAKVLDLPYSIHAFQHLRGVQERANLTSPLLSKEDPIFNALSHKLGPIIDVVGHRIHQALLRNASSWVLYNMASFYWRIKNEPLRAMDCVVRALHFSPRHHKDVALVNMANILHRAHFSADAAVLAHAALDLPSDLFTSHYTLGNIYAMLGEYNHSVLCYEQALQAQPDFELALRRKHAVLCQQKLEQRLEAQHRSLQRTLNELKEYQKQHDHFLRQQEGLDKHKLLKEEQVLHDIIHETQMAKEAQLGNHQICRLGQQQGSLHCPFDLPVRYHRGDLFEHVDFVQFGEEISVASSVALVSDHNSNRTAHSPQLHPSMSGDQDPVAALWSSHYEDTQYVQKLMWPQREDCVREYPSVPPAHLLPTFHFFSETKNHSSVATVLYGNHSPPQTVNLPVCGSVSQVHSTPLPASMDWLFKDKLPDHFASQILQSRSGGLTLEQIGSKIAEKMKLDKLSSWQVHNEASLFWRAQGNGSSALQCLRQVWIKAPHSHRPLALTNAANLMLHYGLTTHAEALVEQALAYNATEPHALLSLVSLRLAQGNVTGALALFRHTMMTAVSSSSSFSSFANCEQCRKSIPLLRCLQFYPFLYNLSSQQPCSQGSVCGPEDDLAIQLEEWEGGEEKEDMSSISAIEDSLLFERVILDTNGSGEAAGKLQAVHSSGMIPSLGGDGVNGEEWQLKEDLMGAFEGALDVSSKQGDLRGIRVLKNDHVIEPHGGGGPCLGNCEDDDGSEWITFQVKRVKKAKVDGTVNVAISDDGQDGEPLPEGNSILEISGPTIPSTGPPGRWRDYTSLGWPGPEECQRTRRVDLTTAASTWLAVSAKNIDITEHIDFATPLQEPAAEPLCNANLAASMHTLDHLAGMANRAAIHYTGESQLSEVLQNLGKEEFSPQSFEQVGTRIAKVLEKNQTSWVLSSMAALYWRVKGQGKRAIDCLRQALNYAPYHMKDVPLISLANIFQNARLWEDALTVARMAVEITPHFVVNHFTLANVYIAMEEFEKAMHWYESTLKLQPEFAPAKDRLRTIQCYLLTKRERRYP
ncbi:tetratricopeptide repeat protein 17 isoform X2 [Corythoichthys intestinalis]|uniref:tetratricopeptide repeat protein 17 isoform X2 n=1 Tax=Corythoichthys intestinalis TaxID=161448 RepID=UPI0025A5BB74|nr:tetratricopeptide repeat protein 17 isoform X2 [Corythoichthys intestinalis]XP_061796358.1 tetratricopeptide repeat protein 17-like [Nerophis lumbriciformis]